MQYCLWHRSKCVSAWYLELVRNKTSDFSEEERQVFGTTGTWWANRITGNKQRRGICPAISISIGIMSLMSDEADDYRCFLLRFFMEYPDWAYLSFACFNGPYDWVLTEREWWFWQWQGFVSFLLFWKKKMIPLILILERIMRPPIRVSRSSCEESFAVAPRVKRTHQVFLYERRIWIWGSIRVRTWYNLCKMDSSSTPRSAVLCSVFHRRFIWNSKQIQLLACMPQGLFIFDL